MTLEEQGIKIWGKPESNQTLKWISMKGTSKALKRDRFYWLKLMGWKLAYCTTLKSGMIKYKFVNPKTTKDRNCSP